MVSKENVFFYTLNKASELINQCLEESCDESVSKIEVFDSLDSYFSEKRMLKLLILLLLINFCN